jgi:multiple antibiotic resistance protein
MTFETAMVAFTTFFTTISPIDVAAMYAALTPGVSAQARRTMAIRGISISTAILLTFALCGDVILAVLGVSLAALKVAGGILLLLIGIDMVFARSSGGTTTTDEEDDEAATRQDISVFPLATPLIAGPGAIGAVILLMADAKGSIGAQVLTVLALVLVLAVTLALLLQATRVQLLLGVTGMHVISRILGILLTALATQFMFDGLAQSGLFGP